MQIWYNDCNEKKVGESMRALFLSVTAGQGHNQTAKAIMNQMTQVGYECKFLDTLEYIAPVLGESVDKSYRMSIAYAPSVYGKVFDMAGRAERKNSVVNVTKLVRASLGKELIDVFYEFQPDVVVSSHCFAAQLAGYIHDEGIYRVPRIGILTDYTLHPFWQGASMDAFVTPSSQLTYQLAQAGIDPAIIRPLGIPVNPKFSQVLDPAQARAALGVEEVPTVLVMGGSMGFGNVVDVIWKLDKMPRNFQILAVCGSNARLKRKIDAMVTRKRLYTYGFTDQVDVMMSAAELIVTKPGGLTVSEALTKRLPMALINPIPGQEDHNMDFLTNHGMAMRVTDHCTVDIVVEQLLGSPERRGMMIKAQETFGNAHATADLCQLIEQIAQRGLADEKTENPG